MVRGALLGEQTHVLSGIHQQQQMIISDFIGIKAQIRCTKLDHGRRGVQFFCCCYCYYYYNNSSCYYYYYTYNNISIIIFIVIIIIIFIHWVLRCSVLLYLLCIVCVLLYLLDRYLVQAKWTNAKPFWSDEKCLLQTLFLLCDELPGWILILGVGDKVIDQ